jgi:hypothetical protein
LFSRFDKGVFDRYGYSRSNPVANEKLKINSRKLDREGPEWMYPSEKEEFFFPPEECIYTLEELAIMDGEYDPENLPIDYTKLQASERYTKKEKREDNKSNNMPLKIKGAIKDKKTLHKCSLRYLLPYGNGDTLRSTLPVDLFTYDALMDVLNEKRIQWYPSCKIERIGNKKGYNYFTVQEFPFIVLDIDDVDPVQAEADIRSKWKYSQYASVAPSSSGKGIHVHVMLDITKLAADHNIPDSQDQKTTFYKNSYRYSALITLKNYFKKSIQAACKDLKVDSKALKQDYIAINPNEINIINNFWKDKSPLKITEEYLAPLWGKHYDHSIKNPKGAARTRKFTKELKAFVKDKESAKEIFNFIQAECGEKPRPIKEYEVLLKYLSNNIQLAIMYIQNNFTEKRMFKLRFKETIKLPVLKAFSDLFGLVRRGAETAQRHIVRYILSLKKTGEYQRHIKCDEFGYVKSNKKYFGHKLLNKLWFFRAVSEFVKKIPTIRTISSSLGNGNTWESLSRYIPFLTRAVGEDKTKLMISEALAMSNANHKGKRTGEAMRFIRKIADQERRAYDSNRRWASAN